MDPIDPSPGVPTVTGEEELLGDEQTGYVDMFKVC